MICDAAAQENAQDEGAMADEAQATASTDAWAARNAKDRKDALKWILTDPCAWIILMRMVMEPFRQLQQWQLTISSQKWEISQ